MLLEFLPTLEVHRELYSMPRGMERFRAYIARMTGGSGDLALPIAAMNPMGKEHMISAVEAWIACGAEEAAVEAVREAAQRFSHRPDRLRVALVLAAAGLYGVLSGSVAERTREIGVRAALGASRGSILALIVRQGIGLTGLGVAIGLAGAAAASQTIEAMLFGVSRLDPLTYLSVVALLAVVSTIACAVPAWRAVRVDPASTLRAE